MNARFGIHMGPRQVELVERVRREGMIDVTGNRTYDREIAERQIVQGPPPKGSRKKHPEDLG